MNGIQPSPGAKERDIFLEALDQATLPERAAYLDRACGGDSLLRAAVEALLQNHKEDKFLETPVVEASGTGPGGTVRLVAVTEQVGDRIGRYKLLQQIGEGGCGVVYMAEQEEPVRRRVALKVIKLGMDTKSVIARFEAERQALAMMDHSNIAKVLDGGATRTGRPYFVMELVRGIKITEYCDQDKLQTEERLKLFNQVCQAIQHAHQKGIIHRDIKPSNILVTLHDGVAVPKVIDFGIAKAIEQRLTDKTLFTEFQAFIGTPAYTSPEQAEMSGLDLDTRSDIYSLGVLLYELLTGQTPFDPEHLLRSGLNEMRRIIREEEPIRPSTRLSTLGMAEATALIKARQARLPALADEVRGDLDWIVMKCLEKDRTRRYATSSDLAMDIQRYLEDEPVLARPPTTAYRIEKFIRRNRVIVAASATVAIVLLLAAVVSSWQAIRATQAEHEQSRLRQTADQALQNEEKQRGRAETEKIAALRRAYNSDMNLVQQALAANNYGRVVDLLNRQRPKTKLEPDFRQWEWRYFWNQSRSDAAFALPQQSNSIITVAISPNGRLLASNDRDGALKLWDLTKRTQVALIRERGFGPSAFAFSRDGERLAVAVNEGPRRSVVKVWNVAMRQVTGEFPHEGGVETLAFNADATKLLTSGRDMAVRVWVLGTTQLEKRLNLQTPQITERESWQRKAIFSPDGKSIAIGVAGRIRLLDVETGEERCSINAFEEDIASLAFSPNGELLAASPWFTGTTTTIRLFSTATGEERGQLIGHVSWVPGLTFTADGKRLVSAGADQTIRLWDVDSRQELAALRGHLSEINCVAVTPDGKTIVSGCKDGTLLGWDAAPIESKKPFATLPTRVADLEFLPDSQGMLSVNTDGSVTLWDAAGLHETERLSALGSNVTRILIASDGSRLFAGTRRGEIKVFDWATRLVVTNLAGFPGETAPVGLIHQGRTLIAAGVDFRTRPPETAIRAWDTATWQLNTTWKGINSPPFPQIARPIVSHDERFLLVAGRNGIVDFRDLQTGQSAFTLAGQLMGVSSMSFSADGRLFATASIDGTVNFYDPATREIVDVLRGHLLGVHAVAFSGDRQRLASASHGNEAVKLWDVETRHEVATLAGEGALFYLAKFSPDGRMLVAVNLQGKAHLWRAPSLEEIEKAEAQDL